MFRKSLLFASAMALAMPAFSQEAATLSESPDTSAASETDAATAETSETETMGTETTSEEVPGEADVAEAIASGQTVTASEISDAEIVSLEGDYDQAIWDGGQPLAATVADLTEIGEVESVVLRTNGQMLGVTTDVGGFLGLGTKRVLIPLADLRLVRSPSGEDLRVVTRLGEGELQDLPEYGD